MKTDHTFFLIGRIKENCTAFLEKEMKAMGMAKFATSHADIMAVLNIFGELSMSEISGMINRDCSTVTALVSKLEKMGYVRQRRSESDRRSSLCSLTEKGKAFIPDINVISKKLYKKAVTGISEKEWKAFRGVLEKLHRNLA